MRNGSHGQPIDFGERPDLCRVCEAAEQSRALAPLPICARCAYEIHDVIARAHGRNPGPLPSEIGRPKPQRPGHVYYIRRGDLIKIGFTVDLAERMRSHLPDEVLAIEPGTYQLEAERHRQFAAHRYAKHREWFTDDWPLLQHINLLREIHGAPPPLPTLLNR